jgi:single-strand DNA-binding protein
MSKGVNKVMLLGHLGKDPEIRALQSGTNVANANIATTERRKIDGEWQEQTEWTRLVFWDKVADIAAQYLHKGSKIFVEGKLKTRSYEQNGETKYITEVHVNELTMLDSGQQSAVSGQQSAFGDQRQSNPTLDPSPGGEGKDWQNLYGDKKEVARPAVDEDVPF